MKQLQQRIIDEVRSDDMLEQEKGLEAQITERAKQEETLWRQKSRIRWLIKERKTQSFFTAPQSSAERITI